MNKVLKICFWAALTLLFGTSVAMAEPNAYITNNTSNTVSVIDTATYKVTATVPVGTSPMGVAVTPDGTKVYVANRTTNDIYSIDTATNTAVSIPVGAGPMGIAVTPDGSRVYVSNTLSNDVYAIDTATSAVAAVIPVGMNPDGVAIAPNGSQVYVSMTASNDVYAIDTATNTVIGTVPVGLGPMGVAFSPDGSRVYVVNEQSNDVSVINTDIYASIATIPVGTGPIGIAVDSRGSFVYVVNSVPNNVSVIDALSNTVVATIPVGVNPYGISFHPTSPLAYVSNSGEPTVSVIDTNTRAVIATINIGANGARAYGKFIGGPDPVANPLDPIIDSFETGSLTADWMYSNAVEVLPAALFNPLLTPPQGSYFALLSTTPNQLTGVDSGVDFDGVAGNEKDMAMLSRRFSVTQPGLISFDVAMLTGESPSAPNSDIAGCALDGYPVWSAASADGSGGYTGFPFGGAFNGVPYAVTSGGPTSGSSFGMGAAAFTKVFAPIAAAGNHTLACFAADGFADGSVDSGLLLDSVGFAQAAVDLAVTKAGVPNPVFVGQNFTYTFTVTNNGPVAATFVTLTDSLPPSLAYVSDDAGCTGAPNLVCTFPSLAAGATATVNMVVAPVSTGVITNTASVASAEPDPNTGNNSATTTTSATSSTDLSVTITDSPDPVKIQDPLTYTVTVWNNGPSDATNVVLTDVLPGSVTYGSNDMGCLQAGSTVTCNVPVITAGSSWTVNIGVTPTMEGSITNTASVTGDQNDTNLSNNQVSQVTTVNAKADLVITKTDAPAMVTVGTTVTYTLTVTNNGPSNVTNVQVTDMLPAGVNVSSILPSAGGVCTQSGSNINCNFLSLANGSSVTVNVDVVPTAAVAGTTITNSASVNAAEFDQNPTNNTTSVGTLVRKADLTLSKGYLSSDPSGLVTVGTPVTYTLTVDNAGPQNATGVVLTDNLPAGMGFNSVTDNVTGTACTQVAGTVTCNFASLPVGPAVATVTIGVTPNTSIAGTVATNSASVIAFEYDPTPATASVGTLVRMADLTLSKVDAPTLVTVGTPVTYTLTVDNAGPQDATSVVVTDTVPAGMVIDTYSATGGGSCGGAGQVVTCNFASLPVGAATVTIRVIPDVSIAGLTVTNNATVSAFEYDPTIPNTASVGTRIRVADLAISKVDTPDPVQAGQRLTYTLTVDNNGPDDANSVVVTDSLSTNVTFVSVADNVTGTACTQVGGVVTCNFATLAATGPGVAVVDIVVTPHVAGLLSNTASVSAFEYDPYTGDNSSQILTTVTQPAVPITSGGCVLNPEAEADPTLPVLALFAMAFLATRRRRNHG